MKAKTLLPLNLQFFSDGTDGEPVDGTPGSSAGAAPEQQASSAEAKSYTTDELNSLLAAESEKYAKQAIKEFKEKELPSLIAGAKSEAERLSKMTADQKAEHTRKQQEEDLARRTAEVTKKELRIEAHGILTERKLPVELLGILSYNSAEECKASIDAAEKAFRAAVQAGIDERLKGTTPKSPHTPGIGNNPWLKETFNLTEQGRLMRDNPVLAQQFKAQAGQ